MKKLILIIALSLPIFADDTLLKYWKDRALAAEASYKYANSLSAGQKYQAEVSQLHATAAKQSQDIFTKACTEAGKIATEDPTTFEPVCSPKPETKPEPKKK